MKTSTSDFTMNLDRSTEIPTLYYVYDALCGWCFGMSPAIKELQNQWQGQLDIKVMSGGMVLDSRVGPATDMADYIRGAYKHVEQMTGVTFGKPYLDGTLSNKEAIFNSLKPAHALSAAKLLSPGIDVDFAHAIQQAIFVEGQLPDVWDTYYNIASKLGLDLDQYKTLSASDEVQQATKTDFALTFGFGVTGFPTIMLAHQEKLHTISQGFSPAKTISERITKVIEEA